MSPSPGAVPEPFKPNSGDLSSLKFGPREQGSHLSTISTDTWEKLSLIGQGLDPTTESPMTMAQVAEHWAGVMRQELAVRESPMIVRHAKNIWIMLISPSGEQLSVSMLNTPLAVCTLREKPFESFTMRIWAEERRLYWQPAFDFPTFKPENGQVTTTINANYQGVTGFVLTMSREASETNPTTGLLGAGTEYVFRLSEFPNDGRLRATRIEPYQSLGDQVAAIARLCASHFGVSTDTSWPAPLSKAELIGCWHRFHLGPLEVGIGASAFIGHVQRHHDPVTGTRTVTEKIRCPAEAIGFSLCDSTGVLGPDWLTMARRLVSGETDCNAMARTVKQRGNLITGEYFLHSGFSLLGALVKLQASLPSLPHR